MRHGGATNRPGTKFVGEVKDSTKAVRLIPWVFSTSQTYILELGHQYIRFIKNGSQVKLTAKVISAITKANPAVVTATSHGYSNGDEVYISGVVGMTEVNGRNFKVAGVTTHTFQLTDLGGTNINSTSYTTYSSAGTAEKLYVLTTTYDEGDLFDIRYIQSADKMTFTHPDYAPRELERTADTSWTLTSISFVPSIDAPENLSGGAGSFNKYKVTAVKDETFEESLPSDLDSCGNVEPSIDDAGTWITLTWDEVDEAREYNVYRAVNDIYAFVGTAGLNGGSPEFVDRGITPDTSDTPPVARTPFNSTDNYPTCCAYIQQRLMFANTNTDTEKIWGSRTGRFSNFTISTPIQDDDAVTFTMNGRQVNAIKHMLDIGKFIVFTETGEWTVNGDSAGILTPSDINPRQQDYNGSNRLAPLVISGSALYVQARGSIVRDLLFDYQSEGYRGKDLTVYSSHLFDNFDLVDWTYQKIPHSNVWVVRDDGDLNCLTYIREHEIWGWSRHDFHGGSAESSASIAEGFEDSTYFIIARTIDGRAVRYIERFATRHLEEIEDFIGMDCALTYDGTNAGATTMTLSGGTTWTYDETLTLTASASYFLSTDVGNAIHLTGADGTIIRCTITAYSGATIVSVQPHETVPVAMRSTARTTWGKAVDELSNLWHLEGEEVSVFGDGFVVASPNNVSMDVLTVTDGAITLDRPYQVIHVGIPVTSDIETLDIDSAQGETMVDKRKNISRVSIRMEDSRGVWVGSSAPSDDSSDPLEGLTELKIRDSEGYDEPVNLTTGIVDVNIRPEWNSNGRVFIRQVDPVPMTILSIAPSGLIPFRGGA